MFSVQQVYFWSLLTKSSLISINIHAKLWRPTQVCKQQVFEQSSQLSSTAQTPCISHNSFLSKTLQSLQYAAIIDNAITHNINNFRRTNYTNLSCTREYFSATHNMHDRSRTPTPSRKLIKIAFWKAKQLTNLYDFPEALEISHSQMFNTDVMLKYV